MQKYTYNSGFTTNFEFLKQEKSPFTLLYIHGLCSDPWGKKPETVKNYASKHGIDFLRFELAGHGSDADNFAKTDMNIWKNQVLEIIDTMIKGPIVVIGSSIGGWLSLITAKERPTRIIGFVGIAAAPDFMRPMYEQVFTEQQRQEIQTKGYTEYGNKDFSYHFTKKLIESGFENELLNSEKLEINCPIFLIHGTEDASIPYKHAFTIANKLTSKQVTIKIRKGSNHRLNEDSDLFEVLSSIEYFIK